MYCNNVAVGACNGSSRAHAFLVVACCEMIRYRWVKFHKDCRCVNPVTTFLSHLIFIWRSASVLTHEILNRTMKMWVCLCVNPIPTRLFLCSKTKVGGGGAHCAPPPSPSKNVVTLLRIHSSEVFLKACPRMSLLTQLWFTWKPWLAF